MPTLTTADLNGFTGCDQWTRHWMSRNLIYSEGMAYVAENAGGGAHWLLDAIASHEVANPELVAAKHANPDFDYLHFWYLTVDAEKHTAVLECKIDSERPAVVTQAIEYTDCPFSLTIYAGNDGPGTPTKLFLPSEY